MSLPVGPRAWAAHLTRMLNLVHSGGGRFPVDVARLAVEFSAQVYPLDPIRRVEGASLDGFEGALIPIPGQRRGWGIAYNSDITSRGRINFTLGHELGHYLVHRHAHPGGLSCSAEDVAAADRKIEREADLFAADLLMPLDDFRRQIPPRDRPDVDALSGCASRYGVSLVASVLRWLGYTERRAVLAVSRDGYILWSRSSEPALRTGAFFRTSREPVEVPPASLAARPGAAAEARGGSVMAPGVWLAEEVTEMTVFSEQHDMALSLLVLGDPPDRRFFRDDTGRTVAVPVERRRP